MIPFSNEEAFARFFEPRMTTSPKVVLDSSQMKIVRDFVALVHQRKIREYPSDAKQIVDRHVIGKMCEYGVLGGYNKTEYFDDSIGDSWDYNTPDLWKSPVHKTHLPDLRIPAEIKSCNLRSRNVPLVEKSPIKITIDGSRYTCPYIICIGDHITGTVWIIGIASPDVLIQNSHISLIKNAKNDRKTAFYGADKLIPVPKTLDELREVCKSMMKKA